MKDKQGSPQIVILFVLVIVSAIIMLRDNNAGRFITQNRESVDKLVNVDLSECELVSIGDDKLRLTIPADYVAEATQEELNETAAKLGYESITLNPSGSATYILTNAQHEEMIANLATGLNAKLKSMNQSKKYPHFIDIKVNDDFSEYNVYIKANSLNTDESMSGIAMEMYTIMYNAFNGITDSHTIVNYYNIDTGVLIYTHDSKNGSDQ